MIDIQNIVTDQDTELLDSEITQISNDLTETYYFDNDQTEELEMFVAKAMKLGELYERKKWQEAKANAVPEGFVLVPKESITHFWQDNDEPENFCSKESDFDCLGDGVDIGDVLIVNKYKQANIGVKKLFGVWCSCEPKPFTRSTIEFRLFETHAVVKQAMIEALEVK